MSFIRITKSTIFLLLIMWRVSSVFIVRSSHVPDEYWQSLEVAHKLAFKYGYLTWEWRIGIRSFIYPFLISIFYSLTNLLKVDYDFILITMPRIFQALLSAYSEYRFYIWTGSKFALFNLIINWYWYYCATRTLINTFETCLTIIALSVYPWKDSRKCSIYMWTVAFLCFIRPTAVIIWLPLCLYHLSKDKYISSKYLFIGFSCLIFTTLIDAVCYDKVVITPFEFFKINVVRSISEQYGKMHLFWYFTSGLPVILGLHCGLLPFAVFKIYKNSIYLYKSMVLTIVAIWSISIYSLLAHKEFRFILPLLPIFIYIIHESFCLQKIDKYKKKFLVFLLIISNVLPGFYFSCLHQQGALKVMKYLRSEIETNNSAQVDVLFLTVCHSTPFYSHLHKNISMRFLTCEPNLENIQNYFDETDEFFMDPMKWLNLNYLTKTVINLPTYVIVYDSTVEFIQSFLQHYKILDSNTSLDQICGTLDNLTIQNLELFEEKIQMTIELEKLLRKGYLELAKARYIRGRESIGLLQIPSEENEIKSLFNVETVYIKSNNHANIQIPNFDISLKKLNEEEEPQNPINWFGVLVPQSLKSAQKYFQDAVYLSVKLANIQAELSKITHETTSCSLLKKTIM